VDKKYNIGKKWSSVFSYTLWMFGYYIRKTKNELLLDDVDVMILTGLKNINATETKITLNDDQMKFFLVLVDYVNKKLLDEIDPPYTKKEMDYFKLSQCFMEKFNKSDDLYKDWTDSRVGILETIKY